MGEFFFLFLFVLFAVAVAVKEDFVFLLLYLFAGAFILGRWWGQRVLQGVQVERIFPERAFLGERVRVDLNIKNTGWLPAPWLQVRESLPVELRTGEMSGPAFQHVASLGPYGLLQLAYPLDCRKRGYYALGPLDLYAGDVLGVAQVQHSRQAAQHLTIYPRIISLTHVKLPSQAPLGTLRHTQPVFEDPSRVMGKRDYVAGDSLRRVDWKATATTGRMQIKLFEPSIALETAIFLNLNAAEYDARSRYDVTELEIVVAASLANWVIGARQAAGLYANGVDMAGGAGTSGAGTGGAGTRPAPTEGGTIGTDTRTVQMAGAEARGAGARTVAIPPRRGQSHLLRILEALARLQAAETFSFVDLLNRERPGLSWGATLILVTNSAGEALFDSLFQARRAGLTVFVVLCGPLSGFAEIQRKAAYFGFPFQHILNEHDLDRWRQ